MNDNDLIFLKDDVKKHTKQIRDIDEHLDRLESKLDVLTKKLDRLIENLGLMK